MKSIYRMFVSLVLVALFSGYACGAEVQWNGQVSDTTCGSSHSKMLVKHPLANPTPENCGVYCIRNGAQYIFVYEGKVYKIANQKYPLLKVQIGHTVLMTGDLNDAGDTLTVTHMIVPPTEVHIPVQVN